MLDSFNCSPVHMTHFLLAIPSTNITSQQIPIYLKILQLSTKNNAKISKKTCKTNNFPINSLTFSFFSLWLSIYFSFFFYSRKLASIRGSKISVNLCQKILHFNQTRKGPLSKNNFSKKFYLLNL